MSNNLASSNRSSKSRSSKSRGSYRGQAKLNEANDMPINKGVESTHSMTHSDSSDQTLSYRQHSLSEGSARTFTRDNSVSGSSSSEYHVDTAKFTELVDSIKPYWNTKISELPSKIFDTFSAIKLLIAGAGSTANHMILLSIVDEAMKDINYNEVTPDTIAAKLIGCTIPTCPGIPIGCSQLCAGSISRPEELTGVSKCDHAVYLFNNESFITLTYGSSNPSYKAYIYVPKDFKSFTQSAVDALKRNGVKEVLIAHLGDKPSTCDSVATSFVPVDSLLYSNVSAVNIKKQESTPTFDGNVTDIQGSNGISPWWWVLLIILILILIGVGIYFARMQNLKAGHQMAEADGDELHAKQTPNMSEFDYIAGMKPYSRY